MIKRITQLGLYLLIAYALPATAGQMYRYITPDGVTVISRTLPPSMSQSGYDILNDKTMRVIRHVDPALTNEEIANMLAVEKEKKAQQEANEKNQQQAETDAEFLAAYHSEKSLIRDRDHELAKRDKEIEAAKEKQSRLHDNLHNLQEQAAEQELSGQGVSEQLQSNLNIVDNNIEQNQLILTRQEAERLDRSAWYETKLKQLQKILATK